MPDFIPNSFQTPNDYVDRFMHLLTPEEWMVLSYTVRRIFGFNKRQDRISLSQYVGGTVSDETGEPLDYGTGLSRPAVVKALEALELFGLQVMVEPNDKRLNNGACYTLQLNPKKVDVAGLEARAAERRQKGAERTKKARALNPRHKHPSKSDLLPLSDSPVSATNHPPVSETAGPRLAGQTEAGKSDLPPPVSATNSQNTEGNPGENQGKHTHTGAGSAPGNGNGKQVCVCDTMHGSKFCDAERIELARTKPGVRDPVSYAKNPEARRGTYDAEYSRLRKALKQQAAATALERDTSACPDCRGKNFIYPHGDTPEGRSKGVKKCLHPKLEEELQRLEDQYAEAQKELHDAAVSH